METHLPVASSNKAQGLTLPRRVGLLGGVSWHSTLEYYKIINTVVQQNLGGLHSAEIIMFSFNFAEVEEHQRRGDWESLTNLIVDEGLRLKNAGAQCLVICSNTLHMMADDVIERVGVPLIHIADSTAELILVRRITRLGLLGTRPTMEGDFYTDRLRERYNLEVIIPPPEARGEIHRVIFEELCKGDIRDEARVFFEGVISDLVQRGAEGIILGCTEIENLITENYARVPIFATAKIHAEAVARWSLRLDSAAKVLKSGG